MNISKRRKNLAIMDFHFLIGTPKGVEHLTNHHELALYEKEKFLKIMKDEGFEAQFLEEGLMPKRGLYIGIRG